MKLILPDQYLVIQRIDGKKLLKLTLKSYSWRSWAPGLAMPWLVSACATPKGSPVWSFAWLAPAGVNSLTAMNTYLQQLFFRLHKRLISLPIFVHSKIWIHQKLPKLVSYNTLNLLFHEAHCINELSWGSILCYKLHANN